MDAYEATRVVFSRIQTLDPQNASKIMGLLLIQDHGEKEMIRLALGPESLLQTLILKARKELSLNPNSSSSNSSPRLLPSPNSSWVSAQPFSRANNGGLEEVQQAEELYGDLVDDFAPLFHDQSSVLYQDENLMLQNWAGNGGFGWKPCLYFARGYCKNGVTCRFLHDDKLDAQTQASLAVEQELLLRSKSPYSAFPYSPTGASKNVGFLFNQQNETQRAAALMADDLHKFMVRSPRFDRCDLSILNNPGARQIYLTFPADSTFSEEDVSNYFSIYGPVQDVRIPYQQKRMFGFVTFVYPETVKLILAKGNPHFVCDARVLVKPYKEKGKVPEKYRNKNLERLDFSGCTTPTGLLDSRDPFELPHLGARMLYGTSPTQEAFLRRKLEEQVELQQAIELQGRRFMGLQLLDFKNRGNLNNPSLSVNNNNNLSPVTSDSNNGSDGSSTTNSDQATNQVSVTDNVGPQKVNGSNEEVNAGDKKTEAVTNEDCGFQERGMEHNLPDSPFASPTKAFSQIAESPFLQNEPSNLNNSNNAPFMASPLLPPASIDLASYNSCFFQMPRFSSGHGAIGM